MTPKQVHDVLDDATRAVIKVFEQAGIKLSFVEYDEINTALEPILYAAIPSVTEDEQ